MNKNINKHKSEFVNLILNAVNNDSSDKEAAMAYLSSEGLDVNRIVNEGKRRIKKMQMEINARKTEKEMEEANIYKQQATKWVDDLLNNFDFSLTSIVQTEELAVSFRNVEELNKDDIRNILIKHYTLKFMKEKDGSREH